MTFRSIITLHATPVGWHVTDLEGNVLPVTLAHTAAEQAQCRAEGDVPLSEAFPTAQVVLPTDLDLPDTLQDLTPNDVWVDWKARPDARAATLEEEHMPPAPEHTTYTLSRDGQRPLRFSGTLLAESQGARWAGKDVNRYHNLAVYQAANGQYLVAWSYRTQWQGEAPHDRVEDYATLEAALSALEAFNPVEWVAGYKAIIARYAGYDTGKGYEARQQALEQDVRARYQAQVAELCEALGLVEDFT